MQITQELLKSLFNYDNQTGIFTFKSRAITSRDDIRWNKRYSGKTSGYKHNEGYLSISIKGKQFLAHRMAVLYELGVLPAVVDHANQNRKDNRICNLRVANKSLNGFNSKKPVTNTSGVKGVGFHKQAGKWRARLMVNQSEIHLGLFDRIEDAENAVKAKRLEIHGEFACDG